MTLLFSLGIHDSLYEVRNRLRPEDTLFAYLDDVYVSSPPIRTCDGYDLLNQQLLATAGIQLQTGKTRVWNRAGTCPPSGRFGRGRVEPRRHQDFGHADWFARFRAQLH